MHSSSRHLLFLSLCLALPTLLGPRPAEAGITPRKTLSSRVFWNRGTSPVAEQQFRVPCGDLESYWLKALPPDPSSKNGCDPVLKGCIDLPALYPAPVTWKGVATSLPGNTNNENQSSATVAEQPEAPAAAWVDATTSWNEGTAEYARPTRLAPNGAVPCYGGSCFTPASALGSRDWVAVVDWDDPHGWSVGAMLQRVMGPGPAMVLFPLGLGALTDLAAFSENGPTDVHLLVQLCRIADLADSEGLKPPLEINMSLGRLLEGRDPRGMENCPGELSSSSPGTLACEVTRVLGHLAKDRVSGDSRPGSVALAAAGNFRQEQFPAALSGVVTVGSLDFDSFLKTGLVQPLWEMPAYSDKPMALMPGYGLSLGPQDGWRTAWYAPAGSSYSTAILSGWLARAILAGELGDGAGDAVPQGWAPSWQCPDAGCLASLACENRRLESGASEVTAFLHEQALDKVNPWVSVPLGRVGIPLAAGAPTPDAIELLGVKSLLELLAEIYVPAPQSDPCLPCGGVNPPFHQRQPGALGAGLAAREGSFDVGVLAGGGSPLPSGLTLSALYLRTGGQMQQLDASRIVLDALAKGNVPGLVISGMVRSFQLTDTPSMILILSYHLPESNEEENFWISVPIYSL
ncbi:MAG: hypothetical protein U0002_04365 [Thermoanaerobaculia bacterium]